MRNFFTKKYAKYLLLVAVTSLVSVGVTIASCELSKDATETTETVGVEDASPVKDVTTTPEVEVTPASDTDSEGITDAPLVVPDTEHDVETGETVPGC